MPSNVMSSPLSNAMTSLLSNAIILFQKINPMSSLEPGTSKLENGIIMNNTMLGITMTSLDDLLILAITISSVLRDH